MFWGLTPALNLQHEYRKVCKEIEGKELNILVVGGVDCRHVLLTCARRYRYEKVKLNFYIIDNCVENIAKQLLLLNITLQPQLVLGLEQKTKIFMELFGNTLVRPSVAKYLTATARELVKMVTNYDYMQQIMTNITLDIKYKERDYLENLLKFWCSKDDFNICDSWNRRLRKFLGVRYDSKVAAFDWDLHMRLHSIGGNQICNQEYQNFRLNGVAFSWLESEVSKPNRSLVCAILPNGDKYAHYGYLGDIQTGPFVAYGLECEDETFLKSMNGQNSHRATDVTERNLKQLFHEIHNQSEYTHQKTSDYQLGSIVIKQEKLVVDIKAVEVIRKPSGKCLEMNDVKISFLSASLLDVMKYNDKYKENFDVIYFGSTYLKYFDKELIEKVARGPLALVLIENQRFVLGNRKEQLEEFAKNIQDKVKDLDVSRPAFDVQKDNFAKFIIKKNMCTKNKVKSN